MRNSPTRVLAANRSWQTLAGTCIAAGVTVDQNVKPICLFKKKI